MSDQLRSLEALTQIVLDADLAKLRRLADETRLRQDEIARLGAACVARSAAMRGADAAADLALQTGQDARWQAWVAREKGRLAHEAAEIASRREAQKKIAQRAFGQREALAGIRQLEDDERRMRAARRLHSDPEGQGS